jgi:hypothetical protein
VTDEEITRFALQLGEAERVRVGRRLSEHEKRAGRSARPSLRRYVLVGASYEALPILRSSSRMSVSRFLLRRS